MHQTVMDFVTRSLTRVDVAGNDVLEVGAFNVNGTVRPIVEALKPSEYIGIDMRPGPGVDEVVNVYELTERFGTNVFDLVVCAEVLEHVEHWRLAIRQMRAALKPGGLLLLTTRSLGFPLHEYPGDYWRFEESDMKKIFADWDSVHIERDSLVAGVFVYARKTKRYAVDLGLIDVYAMPGGK